MGFDLEVFIPATQRHRVMEANAGFLRGCSSMNPWSMIDFVDERSPYGAAASNCRSRAETARTSEGTSRKYS